MGVELKGKSGRQRGAEELRRDSDLMKRDGPRLKKPRKKNAGGTQISVNEISEPKRGKQETGENSDAHQ